MGDPSAALRVTGGKFKVTGGSGLNGGSVGLNFKCLLYQLFGFAVAVGAKFAECF